MAADAAARNAPNAEDFRRHTQHNRVEVRTRLRMTALAQ